MLVNVIRRCYICMIIDLTKTELVLKATFRCDTTVEAAQPFHLLEPTT